MNVMGLLRWAAPVAMLALTACGGAPAMREVVRDDGQRQLLVFTPKDIAAARAAAELYDDALAVACYDALDRRQRDRPLILTDPVGPLSALQKVRNTRRTLQGGLPPDLAPCAALGVDGLAGLSRLLRRGAL